MLAIATLDEWLNHLPSPTLVVLLSVVASPAPFVVLATSVASGPIVIHNALISFLISRHITRTGKLDIIQRDGKRLRNPLKGGKRSSDENPDLPLTNAGLVCIANAGFLFNQPPTMTSSIPRVPTPHACKQNSAWVNRHWSLRIIHLVQTLVVSISQLCCVEVRLRVDGNTTMETQTFSSIVKELWLSCSRSSPSLCIFMEYSENLKWLRFLHANPCNATPAEYGLRYDTGQIISHMAEYTNKSVLS